MLAAVPALAPPGAAVALAAADLDGDGRAELVVVPPAGPVRAYRWEKGTLRPAAPDGPVVKLCGAPAAGDLDGDGAEELFLPAGAGPFDRLFKLRPGGDWFNFFTDPNNRPLSGPAGRVAAALDRRGDGRYGFLVGALEYPPRLIELGRDGRLADLAPALALGGAVNARAAVAAPLFGPATDLFVGVEGGANLLFRNRGDGTFVECADALGLADIDEHARGAAVADVGGAALGWANWDGPHRLMAPAASRWRDRATPAFALPTPALGVVVADFDNDGCEEVFVLHHPGEPNRLFRLAADGLTLLDAGGAAEFAAVAAVVMDVDRDGVPELVLGGPGGVTAFRARAAGGWLRVAPRTRLGAPARGATVRATVTGREVLRVIDGGGHEPVAHVGLGAGAATAVTVTWPDGAALTMRDPDPNSTYEVPYPLG